MNSKARDYRLFSLSNIEKVEITNFPFRRHKDFLLSAFAERSFGVFQEKPFDVVWRFSPNAAADAKTFLFHPAQKLEDLCVPKIRFCNIRGEGHRELGMT